MQKPRPAVLAGVLLLCVAFKLIPYVLYQFGMSIDPSNTIYPWNFSPILPLCLFGAAVFADRRLAFVIPVAAWFLADLGIWALAGRADYAFYPEQPVVYLSFALVVSLGFLLRENRSAWTIAGTGLLSATVFFVVSNFGVWAFSGRFGATLSELMRCYTLAIPFFRFSLASMVVFLPVLFSPIALTAKAPEPSAALATQVG